MQVQIEHDLQRQGCLCPICPIGTLEMIIPRLWANSIARLRIRRTAGDRETRRLLQEAENAGHQHVYQTRPAHHRRDYRHLKWPPDLLVN